MHTPGVVSAPMNSYAYAADAIPENSDPALMGLAPDQRRVWFISASRATALNF